MPGKGKLIRPCWRCSQPVRFVPTSAHPRGAWVDGDTRIAHRCLTRSVFIPATDLCLDAQLASDPAPWMARP